MAQTQGERVETLMDDGEWVEAVGKAAGDGRSSEAGGDGWMLCEFEGLWWWAAPGRWRRVVVAQTENPISEKAVLLALIVVYPQMRTTRQIRELLGGTGNAVAGKLRTLEVKGLVKSEAHGISMYWATWPAVCASKVIG